MFLPKPLFCWNPEWVSKYESPWGIFEKFKYANQVTVKDILGFFGSNEVRSKKIITCSLKNCELLMMNGLNEEVIKDFFMIDVKDMNRINLKTVVEQLDTNYQLYIRKNIWYCRECIKMGHHSILHQFKLIHKCPYHEIDLDSCCPECHIQFEYKLSDELCKSPFQCICGYNLLTCNSFTSTWLTFKPEVNDPSVKKWISLDENERKIISNMVMFDGIDIEKYPGAMDHILSALDPGYKSPKEYVHRKIESTQNLRKYGNQLEGYKKVLDSQYDRVYLRFREKINDELYQSTKGTFNSITNHIKKTLLCKHKSCINRTKGNDFSCSYAFAYVHWRKFAEGLKHCFHVENSYYRPKRTDIDNNIFSTSYSDYNEIERFLSKWNGNNQKRKFTSVCSTKWVLNKLVEQLLLNNFYNWTRYAESFGMNQKWEEIYYPYNFKYENIPFFLIKVPNDEKSELQFHIWFDEKNMVGFNGIDLFCPYNSIKKRRRLQRYYSLSNG